MFYYYSACPNLAQCHFKFSDSTAHNELHYKNVRSENFKIVIILFLSQINLTDKKKILYNFKNVTHFHHF